MKGSGHAHLFICFPLRTSRHTHTLRNDDKASQTCISVVLTHTHWPRSEHWTTLSRQWQPKGHIMGKSGRGVSSTAEPSSSSLIIPIIPPLSILSMAKSQKPFCSKGRAEEGESSRTTHSKSRREQCGNMFYLDTWENTRRRKESSVSFTSHKCRSVHTRPVN